ncbi:hypothetical protein JCM8208_004878 [Rhodotorula glutinis]
MPDAADLREGDLQHDTVALLAPSTVGAQVFFILYGLYVAQHARYATGPSYRRLSMPVRATLWLVMGLTSVYGAILFADTVYWTVTVKRSPDEILVGVKLDAVVPLFDAFVAVPVQILLAIRATILIQRPAVRRSFLLVTILAILVSLTGAILSCATTLMYINDTIDDVSLSYNAPTAVWLWAAAIADVLISTCLWWTLRQRLQGYDERTDSLLRTLMHTTLKTAAYTAVLAVAGAAVASATNDGGVYSLVTWAFFLPLPACYALSLYTTMSSRKEIEHYLCPTPTPTTPSFHHSQHSQHRPPPHVASTPQPDLPLPNADHLTVSALATQPVSRSMGRVGVIRWSKEESSFVAPGEPESPPPGEVKAASSAPGVHDYDGDAREDTHVEQETDDSEEERQVVDTVAVLV